MDRIVTVHGLEDIERRLQALPEKIRRRHVKGALEKAMELIREEAERLVPKRKPGTGWEAFVSYGDRLREAIVSKITVRSGGAIGLVGCDYKKVGYGHLVEFGTRPHMIGKIHHPGARKQPFMRPAFDKNGQEALETVIDALAKAVEKEV